MYVGVDISVCAELWFSHLSRVQLFATPWTLACLASLPMGFPKQEYLSGLPFPTPGDLPNPEVKLTSPALAGGFFTTEPPGKPQCAEWAGTIQRRIARVYRAVCGSRSILIWQWSAFLHVFWVS